jgi:hypothetical protein
VSTAARYAREVQPRALLVSLALAIPLWGTARPASAFVPPNHGAKTMAPRWAGTWITDYGTMHLVQNGALVTGDYRYGAPPAVDGQIEGRIDGLTLRLRWSESTGGAGTGDATFQLAPDGQKFTGSWTSDSAGTPGVWNGRRASSS